MLSDNERHSLMDAIDSLNDLKRLGQLLEICFDQIGTGLTCEEEIDRLELLLGLYADRGQEIQDEIREALEKICRVAGDDCVQNHSPVSLVG
ncbi:hypothetical protein IQ249_25505 [Lusitaniella coriacea LEGE 07157]|uniref:Uncharacterized protein n=1 Tax=Lusitaniella coriacea LEGE 07157 TaxID=945747 RepID=A0A8J7E0I4_9CYAN|nr:hypothetical protein [Lusitaniella coriacea]MBE9119211.1 hypothetical protein [Lusitaniella coriacea LEGE 07157]